MRSYRLFQRIQFFVLAVSLAACGGETQRYQSFDVAQEKDAYRFEVSIPITEFINSMSNGYTDPDLRKLLEQATAENRNPLEAFQALTDAAGTSGYELAKNLGKANPELLGETQTNEEVRQLLVETYTDRMMQNLNRIHTRLDLSEIEHNIELNKDLIIVIELKNSIHLSFVQEYLLGGQGTYLAFYDTYSFYESADYLAYTDSISRLGDSLEGPRYGLYNLLNPAVNAFSGVPDPGQSFVGEVALNDTAEVNKLLRLTHDSLLTPYFHGWERVLNAQGEPGPSMRLHILRPLQVEKCITAVDIDQVTAQESPYEEGRWQIELLFNLNGTIKWAEQTERNLNKPVAVVVGGEIVMAPVVIEPITTGVCVISGNYTQDEAERMASLIETATLAYPMQIVKEGLANR